MANDRIGQLPVEVALSPTSGKARVGQELVEVALSPTSGKARVGQTLVEAVLAPTSGKARVGQVAVEVVMQVVTTVYHDGALAVTGTGAVAAAGVTDDYGDLPVSGVGSLIQVGSVLQSGAHASTGTGSLAQAGSVAQSGALAATGTGTIAQAGSIVQDGALAVSGTGALASSASVLRNDALAISGVGTIASASTALLAGALAATGTGTIDQATSVRQSGALTITGEGTIALAGQIAPSRQVARPDSNVTQTSFTNGFADIDEATASDADFAYGANNTAAVLEVGLTNVTDPAVSTGHIVRYRVAKTNAGTLDGGGNAVTMTVALYQGATLIAADTVRTLDGTWTTYEWTLSGAQADAITDYTDLRLRFTTSASGGSPANRRGGAVSWAELEVPGVVPSELIVAGTGALDLGAQLARPGAWAVSSTGSLAQSGELARDGALSITGTGALAQAAEQGTQGALEITGTGSIAQGGELSRDGALAISGVGTLGQGGLLLVSGALTVTGAGSFAQSAGMGQSIVVDDFDRTVSNGWGTGPLGTWVPGTASQFSVASDLGKILSGSSSEYADIDPLSEQPDHLELAAKFTWDTLAASNYVDLYLYATGFAADYIDCYIYKTDTGNPVLYLGLWDNATSTWTENSLDLGAIFVAHGTVHLKVDYVKSTGVARAKYWNDGTSEPGWQVTTTDLLSMATVGIEVNVYHQTNPSGPGWFFDYVSAPGAAAGGASGSLSVAGTGSISPAGSMTHAAAVALAGTGTLIGAPTLDWSAGLAMFGEGSISLSGQLVLPTSSTPYAIQAFQAPRNIVIKINGVDVTADVRYRDASFTSQVNGTPGSCAFAIRDKGHTHGFTQGHSITVDVDGIRMWRGFVMTVRRQYSLPVVDTTDPIETARWFLIEGPDINILLTKRVLYYKPNPAKFILPPPASMKDPKHPDQFAAGSNTAEVVKYIIRNYTDLLGDGVFLSGITIGGTPNPDFGAAYHPSMTVADFLREVNRLLSGVFYITPNMGLVFRSTETATTNYYLSDQPSDQDAIGPRDYSFTSDATRMVNDALVWGTASGVSTVTFSRSQDATERARHGRWQYGEFNQSMYKQTSVDQRATSLVYGNEQGRAGAHYDAVTCEATIFAPLLFLGDVVYCVSTVFQEGSAHDPPFDPSLELWIKLPVRRMAMSFPTPTSTKLDLLLTQEPDEPWSIYEYVFPNIDFGDFGTWDPFDGGPIGGGLPPPGGGGGCTDEVCGITDTFDRVDTSSGDFGTSDAGIPWIGSNLGNNFLHIQNNQMRLSLGGNGASGGQLDVSTLGRSFSVMSQFAVYDGNFSTPNGSLFGMNIRNTNTNPFADQIGAAWWVEMGSVQNATTGRCLKLRSLGETNAVLSPFAVTEDVQYNVRWEREDGVQQRIKFWPVGDAEPSSWTLTQTLGTATWGSSVIELQAQTLGLNSGSTVLQIYWDNLDITGVDRCTQYRFDNFNRTVSGGWGASDDGKAWTTSLASGMTPSVNGANGLMSLLSGTSREGRMVTATTGPWSNSAWTLRTRVKLTYGAGGCFFVMGVRSLSWLRSPSFKMDVIAGTFGGALSGDPSVAFSYVSGKTYDITYEMVSWVVGTFQWRAKIWETGTTEPTSWMAERTETASSELDDSYSAFTYMRNNSATVAASASIDYIDFDYDGKPCYEVCDETTGQSIQYIVQNADVNHSGDPLWFTHGGYRKNTSGSVFATSVLPNRNIFNGGSSYQYEWVVLGNASLDRARRAKISADPSLGHTGTGTNPTRVGIWTFSSLFTDPTAGPLTTRALDEWFDLRDQPDLVVGPWWEGAGPAGRVWWASVATVGAPDGEVGDIVGQDAWVITIEYGDAPPCTEVLPSEGSPGGSTSGYVCETIAHSGGTVFETTNLFVVGSVEVFVNGGFLSPLADFDQTLAPRSVTLNTAILASDKLYICYQANGA